MTHTGMATTIGLGFRSDMLDWEPAAIEADFFEVAPENWIRRDRAPLYRLLDTGRPIQLHGVSLNLGGYGEFSRDFLRSVCELMDDLGTSYYSDHLAASGDAHQLYDLFPIPFTEAEVIRVSDRIRSVQDVLGRRIGVENTTYYTNVGDLSEAEFLARVVERADCDILVDINNIRVNDKNHRKATIDQFLSQIDCRRASYLHVAGHEFDERFGLYMDTHSQPVEPDTATAARLLAQQYGKAILLEWDNDVPDLATINRELTCLRNSSIS
ncbi:MAG TPA: DUF692 domain-containing protein [Azonexus sp.]|nr:DUF692 domain-containing protein [Azonexus sp.]